MIGTMRDIPKINYNTTLKTKKIINENETTTGTLTKNGFRSYKDFLEHYDSSKNTKDDQESVSSVDSGISESKSYSTSTSSLNSDAPLTKYAPKSDGFSSGRTGSFRKYMETYNNKKFSSVKPNTVSKQNVIKSEIVIQVNTPARIEDMPDFPPPPPPPVDDFDDAYVCEFVPPPPLPPSDVFGLPPPLPSSPPPYSSTLPAPPPPLPSSPPPYSLTLPAPSPPLPSAVPPVTSSLKVPPPLPSLAPPPPPMPFLSVAPAKKWTPVETESYSCPAKEKVPNSAATNLAAVLTQNALFKRKAHESETTNTQTVTDFRVSDCPKSQKQNIVNGDSQKHVVKPFINHRTITVEVPLSSPPKSLQDVDYSTTTVVPITDKSAKVSTSDPNVKKMVYSTYRGLLGAYNNKANGMIATLPRSMVREDRGVSKQLESIALQGGIEKLNGRTNPKVEKD